MKREKWTYKTFKSNYLLIVCLLVPIAIGLIACSKDEQTLVLNEDFLEVADMLQYCQGSCDETLDWEGKPAWVKGYILNFSNDSIRTEYYTDSSFLLQDIRNGMSIEIRVEENKDPVFEKIWPANHKNLFFIKGTATAVVALSGDECTKGVVLTLTDPVNIYFE